MIVNDEHRYVWKSAEPGLMKKFIREKFNSTLRSEAQKAEVIPVQSQDDENQLLAEVTKTFEGALIQRASSRKDKDPDDCIKDIFPIWTRGFDGEEKAEKGSR